MADLEKLCQNLERGGYEVTVYDSAKTCCEGLNRRLDGKTIGFAGSQTVRDMGLFEQLEEHNDCFWHWDKSKPPQEAIRQEATEAEVYIASVNAVSEQGEIVNIDGGGNRVASLLYGHKKVILIVGENKITPDYDSALWRARNVAAPQNARRLEKKTPCVQVGHCCDCHSPDRICAALVVLWEKPALSGSVEVVLVKESLGF